MTPNQRPVELMGKKHYEQCHRCGYQSGLRWHPKRKPPRDWGETIVWIVLTALVVCYIVLGGDDSTGDVPGFWRGPRP